MVCIITPTGARPDQIELCAMFMKRQTYKGKVLWIIIDDCHPRTTDFIADDFRENWTIHKTYPVPSWSPGQNTQTRNISAGIYTLENYPIKNIEAVFMIEDDDYYTPNYLDITMARLKGYSLVGESYTAYYNVYYKRHLPNGNSTWSSLFQTAFRPEIIPDFKKCYGEKLIDICLFQRAGVPRNKINLFRLPIGLNLSVGIKGLPGRAGIGAGHTGNWGSGIDEDYTLLKKLIGNEDANLYTKFAFTGEVPQQVSAQGREHEREKKVTLGNRNSFYRTPRPYRNG